MTYDDLKKRHRAERDNYPTNLSLRVHRSLSWLNRAERCEDLDGQFIFLWIAFNAAYATEIDEQYRLSEQKTFQGFIHKLVELDSAKKMEQLIWQEFPGPIRLLLDNKFVFQSFWDYHNNKIAEEIWKNRFSSSKKAAFNALASRDTSTVLAVVFERIYTLRNQLIHGGATWDSSANREQIRDAVTLMNKFVPLIIKLMMDNPDTLWGDACYPLIDP